MELYHEQKASKSPPSCGPYILVGEDMLRISKMKQGEEQRVIDEKGLPDWLRLKEEDILLLE